MAENGKDRCPYCETDYYPAWTQHSLRIKSPARLEDIEIGHIQVTTCTSCDELIVNLHLGGNNLGKINRKEGDVQLLPPEGGRGYSKLLFRFSSTLKTCGGGKRMSPR